MPNADAYRRFLEQFGLTIDEVPPIMPGKDMARTLMHLKSSRVGIPEEQKAAFDALLQAQEANTTNLLMQNMSQVLNETITSLGLPYQCDTYTGIFPTNSFNAQVTRVDGGALILIDVGCFSLIEALTLLWAWDGDEKRKRFLACRFIRDYVADYKLPDVAEYDHPSLHDGYRALAFSDLISRAEEFVLAHEHAHVALGHIWQATSKQFSTPIGHVPFVEKSVAQELDADQLAIHILFSVKRDRLYWRQAGAAPYIVFGVARLIEKAVQVIQGEKFLHWDTHPPSVLRGAWVEKAIQGWRMDEYIDLGTRFNAWLTSCEDDFEHLLLEGTQDKRSSRTPEIELHTDTPRVCIYVRTNATTTKFDYHENLLLQYCAEQGWRDVTVYRDRIGETIEPTTLSRLQESIAQGGVDPKAYAKVMQLLAATERLDGRRQLMEDISLGKIDIVVVHDFGRLGRNRLEMFEVMTGMLNAHIRLFVPRLGEVKADTVVPTGSQVDYE
ncbi:MAG TPA: recombinase family protein [Chloroflexia bacterium]|nr:recombinase family protein [Chloroflexia bacterium]